ncbi:MAG: DUF169 domain-containing protein [Desulfobacterales bacterium]|nr:DUF169 domain-containing protein [Desulfobacterales bacterium]
MDSNFLNTFTRKWTHYFPGEELPLAAFYSDELHGADFPEKPKENNRGYTCIFSQMAPVRAGKPRAFNQDNFGCPGATGTLGFGTPPTEEEVEHMIDFLTQVERFKKNRACVQGMMMTNPPKPAQGKYLVFKRWDQLTPEDHPQVITFFCTPDALAGLHTLANYDLVDPNGGAIAPFGSGCDGVIGFAMKELESDNPRAVLGLFDPPARGCVKQGLMSISIPLPRLETMVGNMDDCFLNTYIWEKIKKRMVAPKK